METVKDYTLKEQIGGGNFGVVYLALSPSGKQCAIKRLFIDPLDKYSIDYIYNEIEILKSIKSPSIISIIESFTIKSDVFVVTDYCPGGDLKTLIDEDKTIPFVVIQKWLKQLLIALEELRQNNIVHRDIKIANLLLTDKNIEVANIKLCDFGFAKILDEDLTSTYLGTPYYMAPEILKNEDYGYKVDVWSLGVVAYQMYCHDLPFKAKNKVELMDMQQKPIEFDEELNVPEDAQRFIRRMLTLDPKNRPSFEELLADTFFILKKIHHIAENELKNKMDHLILEIPQANQIKIELAKIDRIIENIVSAVSLENIENCVYLNRCISRFLFIHYRQIDSIIKKIRTEFIEVADNLNRILEVQSKIIEENLILYENEKQEITEEDKSNLQSELLTHIENYKFSYGNEFKTLLNIGHTLFPENNVIQDHLQTRNKGYKIF